MTPRANLADLVAGYDALAEHGVDPTRIGTCAASYGAYLSVLLTAFRPVNRLLLRAPALYTDDSFDRGLAQRQFGDPATAPTPLAHLALFRGPIDIVESEHDEVVPHSTIAAYLAARPSATHLVLRGARHVLADPASQASYQRLILGFFADI